MSNRSEDGQDGYGTGITRVSKACDPCRTRKTRCDIATQSVCSECLKRDQAASCTTREKARPNRPLPQQKSASRPRTGDKRGRSPSEGHYSSSPSGSHRNGSIDTALAGPSRHVSFPSLPTFPSAGPSRNAQSSTQSFRPASGPVTVESILEEEALDRFGLKLNVALSPENIFESVQVTRHSLQEIGLTPGDPNAVKQAHHWINTHFRAIHHNTPFLSLPEVLETATRVLSAPTHFPDQAAGHDELALMYAILALGSLREQTYDSQAKKYRNFRSTSGLDDFASPSSNTSLPSYRSRSTAQCLFRLASDELEAIDQPSEIAVQALFVLHTFISNTSMGRRSRDYVARAVMMAHELGLNQRIPLDLNPLQRVKYDKHATRRRAMLYLYVYFSDVYLSALDCHPPLIKTQDYDPKVFDVVYQSSSSGVDTPSGTPLNGLKAFVDLVTTIGSILERLHVSTPSSESRVGVVLQLESEIDGLRDRLGAQTFDADLGESGSMDMVKRASIAGAILRQIHYNWSRIALRAPFLRDPLLRHSSLSICARSALSVLSFHRHVVSAALLNLPWMQLRRVTTSIYLVFIAHWRGEIPRSECETAVNSTLEVLCVIGTRWQSAAKVGQVVVQLADKSGLSYKKPTAEDSSLAQPGNDLAHLAEVATSTTAPDSTLPFFDWASGNASQPDFVDPLNQLLDMSAIQQFNAELASMGISPDMIGWQHALHQPPW